MRLLILGGTRFVGRHLVEAALARGHQVTLFHRGQSGADLFEGQVERILGDRKVDLSALSGQTWDAVIDTCGYLPADVRASCAALKGSVSRYLFISTISVYDKPEPGADEDAAKCPVPEIVSDVVDAESYGYLKVLCEQEVDQAFGEKATHVRPGVVIGPWDVTDRFTYWPAMFSQGGPVIAPDAKTGRFQGIDGRDLAQFTMRLLEEERSGAFNATACQGGYPFRDLMTLCQELRPNVGTVLVDPAELDTLEIKPWADLPMYLGEGPEGFAEIDTRRSLAAGLAPRPLRDTLVDTLNWFENERPAGPLKAGISDDRRIALIESLKARA